VYRSTNHDVNLCDKGMEVDYKGGEVRGAVRVDTSPRVVFMEVDSGFTLDIRR
jgi:hypothetical protein